MAEDRQGISAGPDEDPNNETIAGTGPGILNDALAAKNFPPRQTTKKPNGLPKSPDRRPPEKDTLPLEGE